jgi:hypothetical protein
MNCKHDINRTTELLIKAGLTTAIAGALLLPVSINGNGANASGPGERAPFVQASNTLALPPIPHLDAIPWLALDRSQKAFRTDILLVPESPLSVPAANRTMPVRLSSGMTSLTQKNTNG